MNVVVMATARARIRVGKISDIINQGSEPRAKECGMAQRNTATSTSEPGDVEVKHQPHEDVGGDHHDAN